MTRLILRAPQASNLFIALGEILVVRKLLCCIWNIALSLELNQLIITRSAELHNERSAPPSTGQGKLFNFRVLTMHHLYSYE